MQTIQWGPEGWIFFHVLPFYYANENPKKGQKKMYKEFYVLLKDILPCIYCRQSYKNFLDELPIEENLSGSIPLFKWTYLMHNLVNKKLRDQGYLDSPDPSLNEALTRFKKFCVPPTAEFKHWHMDPKKWLGPTLNFIATIVFNYDEKDPEKVEGYTKLFEIWPYLIAGPEMKVLRKVLIRSPPDLSSQEALIKWYYGIVQELVKGLKKGQSMDEALKELNLDLAYETFEKYVEKFDSRRAKCKQKSCRILSKSSHS